ncbi:hypothetical protein DY000_02007240 [Brassica cretica]|uniref:RNase H type-1 domain-containing protein n=1 Tax=Brassica cretica TaxID=69181 RepID=A0ABQ7C1J8_BRACR|nr:hypothetical protein DY000_02007240 [Brassica cretica]
MIQYLAVAQLTQIPREQNSQADALANLGFSLETNSQLSHSESLVFKTRPCPRKCRGSPEFVFGCWGCPRPGDYVGTRRSSGNPEVTARTSPEMTIEDDHQSISKRNNHSMFTSIDHRARPSVNNERNNRSMFTS